MCGAQTTSQHGVHADNALEWDVILASGERVTASPSENPDLYWGLSGGGEGVFAVILGITVKIFPDGIVTTAKLTFNISSSPSEDAFWSGVETFHSSIPG
jgi:FAD/FMN-containing dehydrogenase